MGVTIFAVRVAYLNWLSQARYYNPMRAEHSRIAFENEGVDRSNGLLFLLDMEMRSLETSIEALVAVTTCLVVLVGLFVLSKLVFKD